VRPACVLFLCSAAAALSQPAAPTAFEVASIRPSQPGRASIRVEPNSVTMQNVTLAECVRWAYGVQEYQVLAPGWALDDWFDVSAKSAEPAKESELRQMLQNLLEQRFKLAVHRETRELAAMILTVGKTGHKLQPVEEEGSPSFSTGSMSLTGKGATIGQLTEFISHELHYPMIDQTGLTGRFNYTLDIKAYVTEEMRKSPGPPPEAPVIVAEAMQAQLGLKVTEKKAPVEMVIIDHVEKTPTEN